jgi:hypothetical protein
VPTKAPSKDALVIGATEGALEAPRGEMVKDAPRAEPPQPKQPFEVPEEHLRKVLKGET